MSAIPTLVRDLTIASMLDIPYGDFHWMRRVDFGTTHYIGADVIAYLVAKNRTRYARNNVTFLELDLLHDTLPHVDLVNRRSDDGAGYDGSERREIAFERPCVYDPEPSVGDAP